MFAMEYNIEEWVNIVLVYVTILNNHGDDDEEEFPFPWGTTPNLPQSRFLFPLYF